MQKSV